MDQMHQPKNSALPIFIAIVITAVVLGGGMWLWQKQNTATTPSATITTTPPATVEDLGTIYKGDVYQITYPTGWSHKGSGSGDDFFFKGGVPSDAEFFSSKQTSLAIVEPPAATDQGMCLKETSEKTITTKNGLTFNLAFNTNDKEGEVCKDAFDHDFVQVFIGNSLKKWMYFTYVLTDTQAEKDLENLLQSIKVKN